MTSTRSDSGSDTTPTQPSIFLALAKDWRRFRNCAFLGVLVAAGTVLVLGSRYTTTASFTPQAPRSAQLSGLAAQFGLDIAGNTGAESPYFYVELLQTKDVLSRVVTQRFNVGDISGDYASFADITTSDSAVRVDKAIKALGRRLNVLVDRRTGIVTVEVTDRHPQLALQLTTALLNEIGRYNRESRQSRAAAERKFVEGRLIAARGEVVASEDSLQKFLSDNREFRTSPSLTFQYDRLQRSVTQHAAVVSTLTQSFEQARIDEVRDTPVISIVQPPELPARADPHGTVLAVALGLGGGLMLALVMQLYVGGLGWLRTESPREYQGWLATLADVRRNFLRL